MPDTPAPFTPPPEPSPISTLTLASMPLAFTQLQPLNTEEFLSQAARRGYRLDASALKDLYRHRLLVPFLYVGTRPTSPGVDLGEAEPWRGGWQLQELRAARNSGRLLDLGQGTVRNRIRFDPRRSTGARPWWNGLLYAQHQFLALADLEAWLASRHRLTTSRALNVRVPARPPRPDAQLRRLMNRYRRVAAAVCAFEARYLPNLDREWLAPVHVDPVHWEEFRDGFDPAAIAEQIGYSAAHALEDAQWLLYRADRLDPLEGHWRALVRRAPREKWEALKGPALAAFDARIAAEILLRFYEEMAERGLAEPLVSLPPHSGHVLEDRVSHRGQTLSADLMDLGLAPQPRVVLAVEGETEAEHMPLVWKALGYPDAPELVRMHKLGGVDHDPVKIGGHIAAPLVSRKDPGGKFWWLIKPPTCFMLAVDPEGKFYQDSKVEQTRAQILAEIKDVLKIQGAGEAIEDAELEVLVEIHRWSEACYEFEHFSNEEIADGLIQIHHTVGGLSRAQLIESIEAERARKLDVKRVWSQWGQGTEDRKPSKVDLARVLWPVLEAKILAAKQDPALPMPTIATVVGHAFRVAQHWRYKSFVLGLKAEHAPEQI
ncbi:hypothetical protein KDL01_10070 [Actinospica durhamensis]|uniref:Uncharacterized protein n=1 Tax=Actinospica durhamensis TaxID=1508375 RepID=A0A941EL36_9ACTN|nr:hypothetical protein [Actinospica durhamensis]MBR7833612.1 hypothetical protein [Actinospica durhamensis]